MKIIRQMISLSLVLAMLCSFLPVMSVDAKTVEIVETVAAEISPLETAALKTLAEGENLDAALAEEVADVSIVKEGDCGLNVTWTLDSNGVLIITGTGDMISNYYNYEVAYEGVPWYPYRRQINTAIIVDGVTCIDHYAFYECVNLTHVTISDSISSIGNDAFYGCNSLTDVYYDGSESGWNKMPVGKNNGNLTDATIHYVSTGGDCEHNYTAVVMAATCTEPGYTVFTCTVCEYSYVDFMDATGHSFVDGMCAACGKLDPEYVFPDDSIVASGTCGDSVTWSLSSDGVLTISGTGHMTTYYASYEDVPWYPDRELINTVVIEDGVESIGYDAFYGCTNLAYVSIPDSVTSLEPSAFENCEALTNIVIPSSVTAIKNNAFYGCSSLKEIVIPDSVISLGANAFRKCTGLVSVIIPESVEAIESNVFDGCNNLTSAGPIGSGCSIEFGWTEAIPDYAFNSVDALSNVIIPEGITSIGDYAFSSCTNLTNMTLPESVSSIGEHAFSNCNQMTAINIPAKVTRIEDHTFSSCNVLSGITIPQGVTYIGESAFDGCYALTDIVLPDSLTYIGLSAFSFTGLTSVIIPESVTSVNSSVFNNCDDLEHVTIPGSLTSFVGGIFYDCPKLTSAGPIGSGCSVEFGWINSIPESAFKTWITLENVILPESISTIEAYAFANCGNLTSIELPEKVTSIGYQAFNNCRNLTSITFSNRIETIANGAFQYCDSLADVVYCGSEEDWANMKIGIDNECLTNARIHFEAGEDEPHVHSYASEEVAPTCTEQGYTTYTCECGDSYVGDYVDATGHSFGDWYQTKAPTETTTGLEQRDCENCDHFETREVEKLEPSNPSGTCGENLTWVFDEETGKLSVSGTGEMYDDNNLTWTSFADDILSVELGNGVTSIGESAFQNCSNLETITIPDGVVTIGEAAFQDCSNLSKVSVPNSVRNIGERVFYNCEKLTTAGPIGGNYDYEFAWKTSIPQNAFYGCVGLLELTIPKEIVSIDDEFRFCKNFRDFFVDTENSNFCSTNGTLFNKNMSVLLKCPAGKSGAYIIPENVTSIEANAFASCNKLTSITIPEMVTSIGKNAFYDCGGLSTISLPNSISILESDVFSYCSNLTSIALPAELTTIGDSAFWACDKLASISIPEKVTSIQKNAFWGCADLSEIVFIKMLLLLITKHSQM